MPEYLAPGVFVEEVDVGAKPIEGVSTSTVGFLGETERGPLKPRLITNFTDFQRVYGSYIESSFLAYSVDGFFRNGGKRCYVARIVPDVNADPASVEITDPTNKTKCIVARAIGPGAWGDKIIMKFDPGSLASKHKNWFKITILYFEKDSDFTDFVTWSKKPEGSPPKPDVLEVYDNLSTDSRSSSYFKKAVNGTSNLVTLWTHADISPGDHPIVKYDKDNPEVKYIPLVANKDDDKAVDLTADIFNGGMLQVMDPYDKSVVEMIHTGLNGFEKLSEISMVCAPDEVKIEGLQDSIITHCEILKDRFAIIQAKREDCNPSKFGELEPKRESKYAAMYLPWLNVIDPVTNLPKLVPPSGHMAGIYARTDVERGVHKAPANEVVKGVTSLQVAVDKGQQEVLNPKGINVIRAFPGRGVIVWGARTISTDPNWKYINVRRLFIFVEKSIERATQWVVFEPNNEKLWSRVTATITQFLTGVWRTGALMGTKADEAFFVKCDRSTMTQDDIDNGRLVCLIGIAPTKPAEFVIFRIAQTKSGAGMEEF